MTDPLLFQPETHEISKSEQAIDALMALHPKGFDLSLDRIGRLLERLGNPHLNMPPVIHVAGTNGKGSCVAFCRAVLEAKGLRVHTHTSPHLVHWHERFRLADPTQKGKSAPADDTLLADAIDRVAQANQGEKITVFEILTAVMFVLFSEQPADVAIVEVGLGGRFDATNVLPKTAVSIIQPISLDHVAYLGDTVEKIAFEKAGIIKAGGRTVIGQQNFAAAGEVLHQRAESLGNQFLIYGQDYFAYEEHGRMVFQHPEGLMDLPLPALGGRHQIANAATALMAVMHAGFEIDAADAEQAMKSVAWPARLQPLTQGNLVGLAPEGSEIWLDGGHNPDAGMVAAEFLASREEVVERPLFLIVGMINTKDASGFFQAFEGMVRHVFTVPVASSDAGVPADILANQCMEIGISAEPIDSVAAALSLLGDQWNGLEREPRILICGSLYLAGEVLHQNGTPPR